MRVQLFVYKTGCVCYLSLGTNPFSDRGSRTQFTWFCVQMWKSSPEYKEQIQNPTNPPKPLSRSTPVSMYSISVWINLTWRQFFSFSVTESPNHCLHVTFRPSGCEQVFLDWFPLFVYSPLSTGYKAAQHANMLWHFACCTDLGALSLAKSGHTGILQMSPSQNPPLPSLNAELCHHQSI